METFRNNFTKFSDDLPEISTAELEKYEAHFELLCKWNDYAGLISPNTIESAFFVHYLDSLKIVEFSKRFLEGSTVSDLGSGGGFPGLVMAIRFRETQITLYERNEKKRGFLENAISTLQLKNCSVKSEPTRNSKASFFVSRATLAPSKLLEYLGDKLDPLGKVVVSWGSKIEEVSAPNFQSGAIERFELPRNFGVRHLQIFEHIAASG